MTRRFLLFAAALLCALAASPADGEQMPIATRAEWLYRQAQYGAAIAAYDTLLRQGYGDARLYYNIGNAYFKRGELARSRLFYERALRLAPGDADIRHNLDVIALRLTDRVEPVPQLFLIRWWNGLKNGSTPYGIFLGGVCLFSALLCIAIIYFWWPVLLVRRVSFVAGLALLLAWFLSTLLLYDRISDDASRSAAVVTAGSVTAKSSPDRSGVDAFTIHEGLKVEIRDEYDRWLKIRLPDGKLGWVSAGTVERI